MLYLKTTALAPASKTRMANLKLSVAVESSSGKASLITKWSLNMLGFLRSCETSKALTGNINFGCRPIIGLIS